MRNLLIKKWSGDDANESSSDDNINPLPYSIIYLFKLEHVNKNILIHALPVIIYLILVQVLFCKFSIKNFMKRKSQKMFSIQWNWFQQKFDYIVGKCGITYEWAKGRCIIIEGMRIVPYSLVYLWNIIPCIHRIFFFLYLCM